MEAPITTVAQPPIAASRAEWLADILRGRVIFGTYRPGRHIREAELQKEFGLSNGPIREALQSLVADGLAERPRQRGVRVVALSQQEIVQLFEVRLALLETAAALAARRGSPEILAEAEALHAEIRAASVHVAAGESPTFSGRLSRWIFRAAANDRLTAVWEKIVLQSLMYVNASLERSPEHSTTPLIHELIDAIVARDEQKARESARRLTRQTLADLGIAADI